MPSRRPGMALWLVLAFAAILLPQPAQALHDQGYACYVCHTLKPGDVRPGSRAVLNLPGNVLPTIPTKPSTTSLPLPGTGGYPISCDYCHRATGDVPTLNMATKAYKHPVDLIQTGDVTTNPNEITCNDCHNGGPSDVAPPSLLARGAGYPDHLNLTAGYTHNLTSNPPHLTQPYWNPASLPGVTRANDTAFWTGVRNNTQNMLCWVCHDGAQASPFTNVTATANIRSEYTGLGNAKGHQVRTAVSGALQPGSALPCYDCHDSHGSVNAGLVLDNQSIYGAATSRLALTTYTGGRPRNDLRVCAQCHDTGLSATAAGTRVEGLDPVDPYNSADTAVIHLSGGVTDNMLLSTKNCLAANNGCHATPHNPIGESVGGQNCAVCHNAIYQAMDAGSSTGYHHVMLSDSAPAAGVYPTNPTPTTAPGDRTCLICHVDHNYFSKSVNPAWSRARNLRTDIALQPDNGIVGQIPVNTDYDNTLANGGICTSCHRNVQAKNNPGTNIKNDGVPSTALVGKPLFGGSAHNYATSSPFITSHFSSDNTAPTSYFQANCAKCHNDTSTKNFQDNTSPMFAVHSSDNASAVNNMLAPLGYSPLTDNLSSNFCYRCHSRTADAIPGAKKPSNGKDYYNNANMDNAAENIYGLFTRTSRHPVNTADQAAGRVVDCLNCHNVHSTRSATGAIAAQVDNTYAFAAYNLADNAYASKRSRSGYCLGCHDGAGPSATLSASAYVPVSVQISNASMNKSLYATRSHWSDNGSLTSTTIKSCDACHDKHGSTARALLGQYDPADGLNKINGVPVSATLTTADNTAICAACHNSAGANYPPTTVSAAGIATQEGYRDATGYFAAPGTVVRWAGKAVYDNAAVSPHGASAKLAPASLGGRAVGECNTCHDPHGTAYSYNMLTDNMAAGNYKLCFDCHGLANSPAGTDNIARFYPAASQGLGAAASATVNTGHNIKTSGGLLPQYTALPCYDCHVTHGSRNGNTQLKSDQRWSNLGDTRNNAANNRTFCLGCHVGYDDAATAGTVENLQRQTAGLNKLKLPATNPIAEHAASNTQSCGACHAGTNVNDNTYGPHYPATGLCDTCHEGQGARSAAAATYNGAHRTHVDNAGYRFACKQCHSWTATQNPAVHKNDAAATQHAEVRFDNQAASWTTIQYATATLFEYRSIYANPYGAAAPVPTYVAGTDNATPDSRQASVRWTNGTCGVVWCHSNANPVLLVQGALGASNTYQSPTWVDNSLAANCTGCHGGDATSGRRIGDNTAPTNGSIVHLKHVNANLGCYKCHSYTVTTTNNRLVNVVDNHVNGIKDVRFSAEVGGTWDNLNKTCSGTSCHGSGAPLADWDNTATVAGCASCHQSMGAGNSYTYTGAHQAHTDNATYKTACEACHSVVSATHAIGVHAGGDNNAATAQYADVFFSDNASSQSYNSQVYYGANLWSNPYGAVGPNPAYAAAGSSAGNDAINPVVSWTAGNCSTVWCHSNANPLTAAGGVRQNAYRTATWGGAQPCTYCHTGQGTAAAMNADNTYLSYAHIRHVATDTGYGMTCDDCHAQTVTNDNTTTIIAGTGFDNHVNGTKTVFFSTTLRTTTINQSAGTWDNANKTCSATYCHSSGVDNVSAGGFTGSVASPRWDNVNIAGCTYCHGGGANTASPMASNAHDNHVNNAGVIGINYTCKRCHNATIQNNDNVTLFSRALHVDGTRNVAFDNGGSFASATVTCTNTLCHQQGNASLPAGAGADNLAIRWDNTTDAGCRRCHGSIAGGTVSGFTGSSLFGEPNYDNGINGNGTQNSHGKHVDAAVDCRNCHRVTVNGTAIDNAAYAAEHINDNVEVFPGPGVTFTWAAGTHTCSNISCHGGNPAVWGASLTCFNCHSGTEQSYKPQPSAGTPNPVDNTQYLSRGHGRASGSYAATLNPGASFDNVSPVAECYYCHSTTAAHTIKNANDPYRLGYGADTNGQQAGGATGAWADDTNGLCLKCHGTAAERSGVALAATSAYNDNNHDMAHARTLIGVWSFTPKCVDCHDPHGDGNNAMIRSGINAPTSATDNNVATGAGSNSKGTPLRTTNISTVAFTDNTGYAANSYAIPGTTTYGICEVCHNQTSAYSRSADATAAHTSTANCMTCHLHGVGFKGMGGPDVGQYFDRRIQAPGPTNYADNSSHPLRGLTDATGSLLFAGSTNCLGCHYSSGPARTSDECLKCHFENTSGANGALGPQHMDKQLQLAAVSGNNLPSGAFTITTIAQYDAWCLQCHDTGATTSLGGLTASAGNKTVIPSAAFANGRHRANGVGCIYCHQPHGRTNAKLIRENSWNRSQAGVTPTLFSVFPSDNLNATYPPLRAQTVNYRARLYWADNVANPYLAEADDDQAYCNTMCHVGRFSATYVKDKIVKRDATSGNYVVNGAPMYRKVYLVNGAEYTIDNTTENHHQHINGEIISTDNMVAAYGTLAGVTGPSYYQYPLTASALPSAYSPSASDLPFLPDYVDTVRDFTNAYNNLGQRIVYRFTCSTCHNPHGNTFANAPGDDGFPDLRLLRANPSTLCVRCHK